MQRYIMIVDASTQGVDEKPIISMGDTIDELVQEFERKSQFYFLENQLPNGANYSPSDTAIIFDMENEGAPLMLERIFQLTKI